MLIAIALGMVLGILLTGIVGWNLMPGLMLHERLSPFGPDETANRIKEIALANNWVVQGIQPLHESIQKHGGAVFPPILLVNICHAGHASNILKTDENKNISVFMPCTISVYQKSDGKTYVGTMNAGLLGKVFGGTVAKVMKEVAAGQRRFVAFTN